MIELNLACQNGSYLDALKERSLIEQSYLFILQKLNQTLDKFGITNKRESFSEALIRLILLESELKVHPKDEKTKVMFDMIEYFKKEITR